MEEGSAAIPLSPEGDGPLAALTLDILLTGGTGILGQTILPMFLERSFHVHALYRSDPPPPNPGVTWLKGDVNLYNLGLTGRCRFERLYHLAGLVSLDDKDAKSLYRINSSGTSNVVQFAQRNGVPWLLYASTAYVNNLERGQPRRSAYELSKWWGECYVREAGHDLGYPFNVSRPPMKTTVFRPAVLVPELGTTAPLQGFLLFVSLVVKAHRWAEKVRRHVETRLHLPAIEPTFRVRGHPKARLNLIPAREVARAIVEEEGAGVRWLTNPNPPMLEDLAEWVGEVIMVRMRFRHRFRASPVEALFERMARPFAPYLWGVDLPSDMAVSALDKGLIQDLVRSLFV